MFKFNFNNEESVSANNSDVRGEESIQWYQSKEIKIPNDAADLVKNIPRNQIITFDYNLPFTFACLSAKEVLTKLREKSDNDKLYDVLKADEKNSDLIPGEYEGGLKVWECTKDLVIYFTKNEIGGGTLTGKSVLDLGCGSGIVGIMCLLYGASVTFQDYNEEVLEALTIPDIFLNCSSVTDKVKLYSGDWSSFLNLVIKNDSDKFDYILTCETIYNPENYKKIIAVIKSLLKRNGVSFVAAKMNYFGIGGSLKEFQAYLKEEGMISDICWEAIEGVARGILKVTFP